MAVMVPYGGPMGLYEGLYGVSMGLCGIYMGPYGVSVGLYGVYVGPYGVSLGLYGVSMGLSGSLWCFYGFLWDLYGVSMGSYGISMVRVVPHVSPCASTATPHLYDTHSTPATLSLRHFRPRPRPFRRSAHYAEYLVRLINERGLDPAALYGAAELRAAAERHLPAGRPPQGDAESDAEYAVRLRELLAREAPVEPRPSRPSPAP